VSTPVAAQTYLSGTARAGDGDSLSVSGISIRLYGIDAPELAQTCSRQGSSWTCGEEARRQLQAIVEGRQVSCRRVDVDEFGRVVARCTAGGWDVGKAMVSAGWATAFRKYSDDYVGDELTAKTAKVGIWGSEFEVPADYRHRHERLAVAARPVVRTVRPSAQTSFSGCSIKGNHSRKGELIYHLPGMPYYAETRAEEMFCSEAEAQAAGYRRSRAHR
jgi:endonuclease YncB( thermonuclease family)